MWTVALRESVSMSECAQNAPVTKFLGKQLINKGDICRIIRIKLSF